MTAFAVILLMAGVAVAALLAAATIWWVARLVGRVTRLDCKVDRFFEVDGDGLSPADRLKFCEQHPRGGAP